MTRIFVILLSQDSFESDCPETKLHTSQFEKVTAQRSLAEHWIVLSDHMIKYQLPHTRLDQINDHKHDVFLYGKLSTKLLSQAANKNTKFMFTKIGRLLFS